MTSGEARVASGRRASFAARIGEYLAERFPVAASLVTAFLLAGTADLVAQAARAAAQGAQDDVLLDARTGMSTLFVFFALFVLRVLDEHKDFEEDRLAHPERALQRGVVSLRELDVMAAVATIALVVAAGSAGVPGLVGALGCLAFLGLMRAEFFCGAFLRARPLLYALTHQVITPLLCFTVAVARSQDASLPPASFAQAGVAAGLGLVFEVGRKVRAPGEEIAGDDSYSSAYGPVRASLLVVVFGLLAAAAAVATAMSLHASSLVVVPALVGAVVVAAGFLGFARRVRDGRGKALLGAVALGALLTYVSVGLAAHDANGALFDSAEGSP